MKHIINLVIVLLISIVTYGQTITTNTTWNTDDFKNQNTIVMPGATLTITGATIVYGATNRIVILPSNDPNIPGGKVVIYNSRLTGGNCVTDPGTGNWLGIRVLSYPSLSQQDIRVGRLIIQEGSCPSIIERAEYGITNFNAETNWDGTTSAGGIIQATGAIIQNCTWGVILKHYQNFRKTNPSIQLPDFSFFRKCTFWKEPVAALGGTDLFPIGHINLDEVEGVGILGCDFSVDNAWINKSNTFYGVLLREAGANITRYSPSLLGNNYTYNNFHDMSFPIYAINNGTSHKITCSYNIFDNNKTSVYLEGCDVPYVCRNTINMTANTPTGEAGIVLAQTEQYTVMENTITNVNQSAGSGTYGIAAFNTGSLSNDIYKNTLNDCNYALYSDGTNKNSLSQTVGLRYICNGVTNIEQTALDMFVTNGIGIAAKQGIQVNTQQQAAGNTFSVGLTTGNHILNNGQQLEYWGPVPTPSPNVINITSGITSNTCPTKICDWPCVTFDEPAQLYHGIITGLTAQLDQHQGTPAYEDYLIEYENWIQAVAEVYTGEPGNPDGTMDYDALYNLYNDAILSGHYGVLSSPAPSKKNLIEYKLRAVGVKIQQGKHDQAVLELQNALNDFVLTEEQYDQLQEVIQVLKWQGELKDNVTNWDDFSQGNKNSLENIANAEPVRMATHYARYTLVKYDNQVFIPKFQTYYKPSMPIELMTIGNSSIYPNPAKDLVSIKDAKSYKIRNLNGVQLLFGEYENSINIQSLASGIYLVEYVDANGELHTEKLIKE